MAEDTDYDAMVEACIRAGNLVNAFGSPELIAAVQIVLFILGKEITKSESERTDKSQGNHRGP